MCAKVSGLQSARCLQALSLKRGGPSSLRGPPQLPLRWCGVCAQGSEAGVGRCTSLERAAAAARTVPPTGLALSRWISRAALRLDSIWRFLRTGVGRALLWVGRPGVVHTHTTATQTCSARTPVQAQQVAEEVDPVQHHVPQGHPPCEGGGRGCVA